MEPYQVFLAYARYGYGHARGRLIGYLTFYAESYVCKGILYHSTSYVISLPLAGGGFVGSPAKGSCQRS